MFFLFCRSLLVIRSSQIIEEIAVIIKDKRQLLNDNAAIVPNVQSSYEKCCKFARPTNDSSRSATVLQIARQPQVAELPCDYCMKRTISS